MARLRQTIVAFFQQDLIEAELLLPWSAQQLRKEIYANCEVLEERAEDEGAVFRLRAEPDTLERLRAQLQPSALEVLDESWQHQGHAGANGTGFGTHFRVRIASPLFEGKPRVARHRMVYDALQDFIDRDGVHALAIEATSP